MAKVKSYEMQIWRNAGYNEAIRVTDEHAKHDRVKHSEKVLRVHKEAYARGWQAAIDFVINNGTIIPIK